MVMRPVDNTVTKILKSSIIAVLVAILMPCPATEGPSAQKVQDCSVPVDLQYLSWSAGRTAAKECHWTDWLVLAENLTALQQRHKKQTIPEPRGRTDLVSIACSQTPSYTARAWIQINSEAFTGFTGYTDSSQATMTWVASHMSKWFTRSQRLINAVQTGPNRPTT